MSNNYNDDDLNDFNDNDDILKDDGFIDSDDNFPDEDYIDEDDADAVFDRNEKVKKRSDIIRRIILVISVGVFIFAAYNLINISSLSLKSFKSSSL
jgi:sortase B